MIKQFLKYLSEILPTPFLFPRPYKILYIQNYQHDDHVRLSVVLSVYKRTSPTVFKLLVWNLAPVFSSPRSHLFVTTADIEPL